MKIFNVFFICFSIYSCNSTKIEEQHEIVETISTPTIDTITSSLVIDSLKLSNAIDSIWNCEKVQAKQLEIETLSNNERHLTILEFEQDNDLLIKLAEDNGVSYVTHLTFNIYPSQNYSIKYYDVIEDELVDFGDWCGEY